jgi:hypothetical protein
MQALHQDARFIAKRRQRRLFTAEQINAIRSDQRSVRQIARDYGVHHKMICGIKCGQYYADVSSGSST